ncbi:uncharacterized protein N0V89_010510 [Didymosphaeria variabile]|uniref:Uncharacterized protein n=1 Tax=Didymosphaeria variabile TaxID=1932322 RepID=A0A9W9C685_9PLEO|nr:uncharacterized protein N0V89_010510 [Didymosphaeria variabile]KAJ4346579.1 hypothetical protein N0V89_010510 [Didymosphaeria variabile]
MLNPLGHALKRNLRSVCSSEFLEALLATIQFFVDLSCNLNEKNDDDCTPVVSLMTGYTTPVPPLVSDMRSIADAIPWTSVFSCFEFSTEFMTNICRHFYHNESGDSLIWTNIYSELKLDHELGPDCLDGPLVRAVTIRNELEVQLILQAPKDLLSEANPDFSIWRALSWPRGLELFISHGFLDKDEYLEMLKAAMHCRYTASMAVLLRSPWFNYETWPVALSTGNTEFMTLIATSLYHEHKRELNQSNMFLSRAAQPDPNYCASLYTAEAMLSSRDGKMTVEAARILHEAGFPYADVNHLQRGTPLCYHAAKSNCTIDNYLRLMSWFVSYGADITATHPTWKTMLLHLIAERITLFCLQAQEVLDYDRQEATNRSNSLSTRPLSNEDIDDIRYAEQQDTHIFELLVEEFNKAWEATQGNIMDFMHGHWSARMITILEERNSLGMEEELQKLEAIGVTVATCEAPLSDSGKVECSCDLAWFQAQVDTILNTI